jgi:phosphopantetheine--protein transferase-like protein
MILGIGVDSVEVHRFKHWHTFSRKKLSRIFSEQEIDYCLQQLNKSAERFAVRFAAREAFFKAFSAAFPDVSIPFLTLCKQVRIEKQGDRPVLLFDDFYTQSFTTHLSFTHTDSVATVFVVIEQK